MAYKRQRPPSPSAAQKRSRGEAKNVTVGTALPPDEEGDDGAFVPVWKQTVTDEQGRRRLHGAFTGGFSAGYFNTVGSKEGWVPKTFVSSRTNRHKDQANAASQRAEDFMDEEDLAEAAESRQLETAQGFASIGVAEHGANDGFFGLFVIEQDTVGVKIAQKMGWRRAQGVGRKVRRLARLDEAMGVASGDATSEHTFAPTDACTMVPLAEEVRRKGLGHRPEARLARTSEKEAASSPSLVLTSLGNSTTSIKPKSVQAKNSSFGVGVLNDTGSDDEDPYELGPKITLNKSIGKEKKFKKPSKFPKSAVAGHTFLTKRELVGSALSASRPPHNGKTPLNGFTIATQSLETKRKFPPPTIPPGWTSARSLVHTSDMQSFPSVADAAKSSTLDAKARASLLHETLLPGKSVFDFISKETRDHIAALTGKTDLPQGLGQSASDGYQAADQAQSKDLWKFVPVLDKAVAAAALAKGAAGWMPYAENQKKRARYVSFLELKAGLKNDLPERLDGVSTSVWVKELHEFAHAAEVFKPSSGIMASRFISSASTRSSAAEPGSSLLRQPAAVPEDPAEQAAKLSMYGAMTRSKLPFHPARLLCKRFDVKSPPEVPTHVDNFNSKATTAEAVSKSSMDEIRHLTLVPNPQLPKTLQGSVPAVLAPEYHAIVDVESNEALLTERASEDLFKAIFGNDADEDDD
ncbi:G patch domain-containing protein 1 [Massariosphaeria phaeospora]|uniref:G patch domain-containing protein 1 n=1 Tax=Massariosphaeria phaeospora TaxID=100035 RepID=A0A7C8HZZ9_9PLEO|nr:G patch domain-containing protein 1 [Massariosphaeria phaeospora]